MADQTEKTKVITTLINEYSKAFPNDELIFVIKERGSGYCSLNGNMPYNELENILSEIGRHIIISRNTLKKPK